MQCLLLTVSAEIAKETTVQLLYVMAVTAIAIRKREPEFARDPLQLFGSGTKTLIPIGWASGCRVSSTSHLIDIIQLSPVIPCLAVDICESYLEVFSPVTGTTRSPTSGRSALQCWSWLMVMRPSHASPL
jgi:hypothetical protein